MARLDLRIVDVVCRLEQISVTILMSIIVTHYVRLTELPLAFSFLLKEHIGITNRSLQLPMRLIMKNMSKINRLNTVVYTIIEKNSYLEKSILERYSMMQKITVTLLSLSLLFGIERKLLCFDLFTELVLHGRLDRNSPISRERLMANGAIVLALGGCSLLVARTSYKTIATDGLSTGPLCKGVCSGYMGFSCLKIASQYLTRAYDYQSYVKRKKR